MNPRLQHRGPSDRAPAKSPAERRAEWRRFCDGGRKIAARAIETDGREVLDLIHFRHFLATTAKDPFPVLEQSASSLATALAITGRAFVDVEVDARRVILAKALDALSLAVDEVLTQSQTEMAASWQRQMGEGRD